jgi:hypothetical protein
MNMKLKLNVEKTELLVIRSKYRTKPVPDIKISVGNAVIKPTSKIRNLGVIFDEKLTFDNQVSTVRQSAYFHLKNIKAVQKYLPSEVFEGLVHAFISSKLDFCNSLLHGIPRSQLYRLQKLQNHAARIITHTKIRDSITPVLLKLHWLPVEQRCVFKVLTLAHRVIYSGSPDYLDVRKRSSVRATRSTTTMILDQPVSRLKSAGDRAFSVSAPALWNLLPTSLTSEVNYITFKRNLKTYLFRKYYFN